MRTRTIALSLTFILPVSLDARTIPKLHDAPIPDITAPQQQAQVVSPFVYAQLGSQDKELQTIEEKITEVKTDVGNLKSEIKPLQETDIRVRFILTILGWLLGIVLTSGLGGWVIHKLQERVKRKPMPPQTGAIA